MRLPALLFAALMPLTAVAADALQTEQDARMFGQQFIQFVVQEDQPALFQLLKDQLAAFDNQVEANTKKLIGNRQRRPASAGAFVRIAHVDTVKIDDFLLRVRFVEMYERYARRWEFAFIKPKDAWLLNNIAEERSLLPLFSK